MIRFCANCGTEVDDNAAFCPTCGQPIDQETESEMPPAPAWPESQPPAPRAPAEPNEPGDPRDRDEPRSADAAPVRGAGGWQAEPEAPSEPDPESDATRPVEPPPKPDVDAEPAPERAAPPARPNGPPSEPREPSRPAVDLPLTMPVTLSSWLIGGGAVLGALGALIAMFDGLGTAIDLLLLVGLLAVAASVFLSDRMPHVPQLRLITLSVVLVAFGVALDRLGFGRAGAGELLLFLGTAAAAIGAIILETGRDQPLGGPGV